MSVASDIPEPYFCVLIWPSKERPGVANLSLWTNTEDLEAKLDSSLLFPVLHAAIWSAAADPGLQAQGPSSQILCGFLPCAHQPHNRRE